MKKSDQTGEGTSPRQERTPAEGRRKNKQWVVKATCVITFVLFWLPSFVEGEMAWYINDFCLLSSILMWMVLSLIQPPMSISDQSLVAAFICFGSGYAIETLLAASNNVLPHFWIFYCSVCIPLILWASVRSYSFESDKVQIGTVHICLWSPLKKKTLFYALAGYPFASIGWYFIQKDKSTGTFSSFKWGQSKYLSRSAHPSSIERKYIVIDTKIPVTDKMVQILKKMNRTETALLWNVFRCRCVSVLKPILKEMGPEWMPKGIEHLPTFYAWKLRRMGKLKLKKTGALYDSGREKIH